MKRTHRKSMKGGRNVLNRVYAPVSHTIRLANNITGQVARTGKNVFGTTVNAARKLVGSTVRGVDGVLGSTVRHTKGAIKNTFFRKSRKAERKH